MKQKIGTVWRHNEERLPGHRLVVVHRGRKGTNDFSLGHVHETYRVVLGKDEHLGQKEKELSELALTERQRVEATLGPSSYLLASAHFRHKLPQGKIWFSVQGAALIPSLLALGFQRPFLHALGVPL